ncbi:CoA transferase subunit A [Photobacterium ganghwense]|uniref:Branched-chain amino acid dehydrogenase n=1 Tax=Photobacterium ganghwense TaxID=320778 RepID=A0A0J1GX96_9GAMM|nr:CoA transferase subunit A [Photobacterium ganghwense]KLV04270.1 branched-chain amino acid dehydrogenase [Photobacterium ganghwense]PSU08102.1 CoA transferase subunit A [Photobacterium ganghwense]QSV14911.1 CoA transferase subunit A [Photobacterium ganghwense]
MKKNINRSEIESLLRDGMTIMIGGFMANGAPEQLIDILLSSSVKNLTLVTTDTGTPNSGSGRLIAARRVRRLLASHIGTNPETGRQMVTGELEVELIPQGTLAERIRAAGAGLGGFLTPTGLGTVIAEGKPVIDVDGQMFLLEKPLRADLALIRGSVVDSKGNTFYRRTTQNFNPLMAMAAETVIVEAHELVETGAIAAENVHTPGLFIDHIYHQEA